MPNNEVRERMDDTMRQEWSRHYDIIQWTVIAIFTVGVGALFGYSMTSSPTDGWWPEITGVALALLGLFWVAGFRSFRANLHGGIENAELREFLRDPGGKGRRFLTQWNVFVVLFIVISVVFMSKMYPKLKTCPAQVAFWAFLPFVLVGFFYIWRMGRQESRSVDKEG